MTPRFQRLAMHLHSLGPRALADFIHEASNRNGIEDQVLERLEVYYRLNSDALEALGGDRFPILPLRRVP